MFFPGTFFFEGVFRGRLEGLCFIFVINLTLQILLFSFYLLYFYIFHIFLENFSSEISCQTSEECALSFFTFALSLRV